MTLVLNRIPSKNHLRLTRDHCHILWDLTLTSCWNSRRRLLLLLLFLIFSHSPEDRTVKRPWACLRSRHLIFPRWEVVQRALMVEDVLCQRPCMAMVSIPPRPHSIHRQMTGLGLSPQSLRDTNGCKKTCLRDLSSGSRRVNLPCSKNRVITICLSRTSRPPAARDLQAQATVSR